MNETKKIDVDDLDRMLSRFFRGDMPQPWPQCGALGCAEAAPGGPRFHPVRRLALAASIVLFFLSYLFLSGVFPRPSGPGLDHRQNIGKGLPSVRHHGAPAPSEK